MDSDIRRRLKDILMLNKVTVNSISNGTAEQRRLNRQINEDATITFETISSIIENFPDLDANWLITGQGEMYKKELNAGRDNNLVEGDNKGITGNTGTIGNMVAENSGNYVSMGDQKVKKLLKDGEITIEMEQSAEIELLQQTNAHLETRIKDLEMLNASQSKTIETMQLLIDTLSKK